MLYSMKNKTILFCDNTLWGLVNFRGVVIEYFIKKGYKVILVAPQRADSDMKAEVPIGVRYIPVELGRSSQNPINDMKYFFSLYSIYKRERPDYIFHYTIKPNIYGTLAARLLKIKSTAMMAGLGYVFMEDNVVNRLARSLYRFALRYSNKVFLLNKQNIEQVISKGICRADNIIFLQGGEGVDLKYFPFVDNNSDEITFLMIGRILWEKGYGEFVETAKRMKLINSKLKFELLGPIDESFPDSVSRKKIEEDEKNGYISYLGFTDDVRAHLKRKGIVIVLPSFYGEGLNRSLMEACAMGKPIITTDIPGCRETVRDGFNGYLVPIKNVDALIAAMNTYCNLSIEERVACSMNSRKWAEECFDVKNVIKEYEKLIN